MWLRMVSKYRPYSLESLPRATGKSWDEWNRIITTERQQKCGVRPLAEYLMTEYGLNAGWAQMIALEYVRRPQRPQYVN